MKILYSDQHEIDVFGFLYQEVSQESDFRRKEGWRDGGTEERRDERTYFKCPLARDAAPFSRQAVGIIQAG